MTAPVSLPPGLQPNEFVCQMLAADGILTLEQCDAVLTRVRGHAASTAAVIGQGEGGTDLRSSAVRWLPRDEDTEWLHARIQGLAQQLNERFWRFDLTDMEPFQVAHYAPGDDYGWHTDLGPGQASLRKLTVVVQLSDPADYDGGGLEFPDVVGPITRQRGSAVVFPAYLRHRVLPVTRGERWSVAGWFVGPPFR